MAIAVRFLSGSLEGREFEIDKDVVRIGDRADADIPIDPNLKDNGGARDRVIEVYREGEEYRLHSFGNRELSAQGDTAIDRRVPPGEEIRFGAWGPIFTIVPARPDLKERTAPVAVMGDDDSSVRRAAAADDSAARRKKLETTGGYRTASGEKPVGPKTVYMMIQDALGKAQGAEGGFARGSVFIREIVTDSIQNATRSFKIGLALLGGALLILIGILFYNIATTKETVSEVSRSADRRVQDVRTELGSELTNLKEGREQLAKEATELTGRLTELEKAKDVDQKVLADLRARLASAEQKRRDLEQRMTAALAELEADRARLVAERERLERERQAEIERQRADEARRAEAERARAAEADAAAQTGAATGSAAPATPAPQ